MMLVSAANPAPKFVQVPSDVLLAALKLGKGHLETLMRLALYLWGGKSLDGTSRNFCEALGIESRTWQRHVPELGRSGCLRYSQPQHGYYVLYGYPDDVQVYSQCWDHVQNEAAKLNGNGPKRHEIPGLVDAFYLSSKTTKLSDPVIVLLSNISPKQNSFFQKEQQHDNPSFPGGSGGVDDASKLSECETTELTQEEREAVLVLTRVGVSQLVAEDLARGYTLEGIREVVAAARACNGGPGWVVKALREDWDVQGPVTRRMPTREDYRRDAEVYGFAGV